MDDKYDQSLITRVRGSVIYGLIFDQLPDAALPRRSGLLPGVRLVNPRFVVSRETPLQYEENDEAEDEDPLFPEDFADREDFYWIALRNLSALYDISTEGLSLMGESEEFGSRWVLGVLVEEVGNTKKPDTLSAYSLPLSLYTALRQKARNFELRLEEWADALGSEEPHIIFTVET